MKKWSRYVVVVLECYMQYNCMCKLNQVGCLIYELRSRHQEPPHTNMSRNFATVVVRCVFPGLRRRRRTGLLPSGPKSSFQMKASFVFHLETKVLESGGRLEKLIAQAA